MQIEIKSLQKIFGDKIAVDIEHFRIKHGDILGLVGNNGAGKTTLFRLMLDLLKAEQGKVLLVPSSSADTFRVSNVKATDCKSDTSMENEQAHAINPATSEEWKTRTGAYINDTFLIDFLTPEEYLDFIAKVSGVSPINWKNIEDKENPLAPFMPLTHGEIFGQKKLIRDFSAGNKQKIGIIAAMFTKPELLILDEPFNFLDPSGQNILKKLLIDFHATYHATILISSHNLQHTVDISTRVALMENGHIIEDMDNPNGKAEQALEEYFKV